MTTHHSRTRLLVAAAVLGCGLCSSAVPALAHSHEPGRTQQAVTKTDRSQIAAYPAHRQTSAHYVIQGTGLGGVVNNVYTKCVHLVPARNGLTDKWACGVRPGDKGVPKPIKDCLRDGGREAVIGGATGAITGLLGGPFAEVTVPSGAAGGAILGAIRGCLERIL